MAKTVASCGHEIEGIGETTMLASGEYDPYTSEFLRGISYEVLCPKCLAYARAENCVLETEEEAQAWWDGTIEKNIW